MNTAGESSNGRTCRCRTLRTVTRPSIEINNNPPDVSRHANAIKPSIAQRSAFSDKCSVSIPRFAMRLFTYNGALSRIRSRSIGTGIIAVSTYFSIWSISLRTTLKLIDTGTVIANNTHTPAERTVEEMISIPRISWTNP